MPFLFVSTAPRFLPGSLTNVFVLRANDLFLTADLHLTYMLPLSHIYHNAICYKNFIDRFNVAIISLLFVKFFFFGTLNRQEMTSNERTHTSDMVETEKLPNTEKSK